MKYSRLFHSAGPEVGFVPQVYKATVNFDIYHPNSAYHLNFAKADESTLWPIPQLSKKAKKTDLLSVSFMSLSGKLLISSKLHNIISKSKTTGIQFVKTELIIKVGKIEEYWILNPFQSDLSFIDCANSHFGFMDSLGRNILEEIQFSSAKDFIEAYKDSQISAIKNPYPNHRPLVINKIAIHENLGIDFFSVMPLIYGGIGFFVSEKLRDEIESVGCTGVVFKDPNQHYP